MSGHIGSHGRTKRALDVAVSAIALATLSPVMAAVAAWVRLRSPGPVIYRGIRVGWKGRSFAIFKFRTMVLNAEAVGPITTKAGDPRIVPGGRFIRTWKLDELPQFINVLRGDMTLVGPRPEMPEAVAHYSDELLQILTARPGLVDFGTLWNHDQAKRLQDSADPYADYMRFIFPAKTRLSLEYVRRQSPWTDLSIALATIGDVLFGIDPTWCIPRDALASATAEVPCESSS